MASISDERLATLTDEVYQLRNKLSTLIHELPNLTDGQLTVLGRARTQLDTAHSNCFAVYSERN